MSKVGTSDVQAEGLSKGQEKEIQGYIARYLTGYQPRATGEPEGQNPPSGGSNVQPPPDLPGKADIQVAIDALWACRQLIIDWPYEGAEALRVIHEIDNGLKALGAKERPTPVTSAASWLQTKANVLEERVDILEKKFRFLEERFSRHASDETHRVIVGGR